MWPWSARSQPQSTPYLPDSALAIVLSHVPPTDARRASGVSKQWMDVTLGMPKLWECMRLVAMLMTASEADSMMIRTGGMLKTLKIELYQGPQGATELIPFSIASRGDWDVALQSLKGAGQLESIEFGPARTYRWLSYRSFIEEFEACASAALDALCAIAGDLPLSLKKISLSNLCFSKALERRHVRAVEAAPCCVDGACKFDVMACENEHCGFVQRREHCCVCAEKRPCNRCFEDDDYDDYYQEAPKDKCDECGSWCCAQQACKDVFDLKRPGCPRMHVLSCAACVNKRPACGGCSRPFCECRSRYCGRRKYDSSCGTCGESFCGACVLHGDALVHCEHGFCKVVECQSCLGTKLAICDHCGEASCKTHNDIHGCLDCENTHCLECARARGHSHGETRFRRTRQRTGEGCCPGPAA